MGQTVHAATHEFIPDGAHEFVEGYGCSATAAAVEAAAGEGGGVEGDRLPRAAHESGGRAEQRHGHERAG